MSDDDYFRRERDACLVSGLNSPRIHPADLALSPVKDVYAGVCHNLLTKVLKVFSTRY
jgi:hypothetical protein